MQRELLLRGAGRGLKTSAAILKVMVPAYCLVTILKYTPVITWVSAFLKPVTAVTGLPGEAALPLVLGATVSLYAAAGALMAIELTGLQVTIVALMLNVCHDLVVESAIARKAGINPVSFVMLRISAAFLAAWSVNFLVKLCFQGGS